MIIVSNTSPLSSLAKIDRLILLQQIYNKIIIPEAVYYELTDIRAGENVNNAIKKATCIETEQITNLPLMIQLESTLDKGEAEAIALAVELRANQLIIVVHPVWVGSNDLLDLALVVS